MRFPWLFIAVGEGIEDTGRVESMVALANACVAHAVYALRTITSIALSIARTAIVNFCTVAFVSPTSAATALGLWRSGSLLLILLLFVALLLFLVFSQFFTVCKGMTDKCKVMLSASSAFVGASCARGRVVGAAACGGLTSGVGCERVHIVGVLVGGVEDLELDVDDMIYCIRQRS
jgi:hypothetical protein